MNLDEDDFPVIVRITEAWDWYTEEYVTPDVSEFTLTY